MQNSNQHDENRGITISEFNHLNLMEFKELISGAEIEVIQIGTTGGKSTTEMLETLDFNCRDVSIIDTKKRNKSLHKSEKSFFRGTSYKGKKR